MSAYNCRIYLNSGFNAVNIPDRPALLNEVDYVDVAALQIYQDEWLDKIAVRAEYDTIKNADYVKVGNWYYFVTSITMTSIDCAQIELAPDFLLSAGGIFHIKFLDGITKRAHVSDDTYGKWCDDDPLTAPSEPLKLDIITQNPAESSNLNYQLVESTLDLGLMGAADGARQFGIDDTGDGESEGVVVPMSYPSMSPATVYKAQGMGTGADLGSTLYPLNQKSSGTNINPIKDGIEKCRTLGIENCITNVVEIPAGYVTVTTNSEETQLGGVGLPASYYFNKVNGTYTGQKFMYDAIKSARDWTYVSEIQGNVLSKNTTLAYNYATVKNKRVLYGKYNRVGILTNAGNKTEYNPENVYDSNETTIQYKVFADPHTNGCPYFNFKTINGYTATNINWMGAVKGLQWKKLPLVFNGASGSALTRQEFANSRQLADMQFAHSRTGFLNELALFADNITGRAAQSAVTEGVGTTVGTIGTAIGAIGASSKLGAALGSFAPGAGTLIGAAAGAVVGGGVAALSSRSRKLAQAQAEYDLQKRNELAQYLTKVGVYVPDIQVSYDNEASRDFEGEKVYLYRYRYSSNDVSRIDKLLTMYGYAVSLPLDYSMVHSREYFNYLECQCSVQGKDDNIPRWWADGISAQLSNGVRIWHILPDTSKYLDNPVRE